MADVLSKVPTNLVYDRTTGKLLEQQIAEILEFLAGVEQLEDLRGIQEQVQQLRETLIGHVEEFEATEGQTVIVFANLYTMGNNELIVEVDGVIQSLNDGYTETSINSITMTEPLAGGAKVKVNIRGALPTDDSRIEDVIDQFNDVKERLIGHIEEFIATEGQTIITLENPYEMDMDELVVSIDGVPQVNGRGYTETTTNSFTVAEPLKEGAKVKVVVRGTIPGEEFKIDDIVEALKGYSEEFVATAGQTVITLTKPYTMGKNELIVEVDGVTQPWNVAYTETTSTSITMVEPLLVGSVVRVSNQSVLPGDDTRIGDLSQQFVQLQATLRSHVETFVATEGQLVINLVNSYTVGADQLSVEIDGVPQAVNVGYKESSTKSITMTEALVAGSIVRVGIRGFLPGDDARVNDLSQQFAELKDDLRGVIEEFVAVEGQTVINLANAYELGKNELIVYVDGVPQVLNAGYSETTTKSITFTEPLEAGTRVKVNVRGVIPGEDSRVDNLLESLRTVTEEFVATEGQTLFVMTNSYTPGKNELLVQIDGVPQPLGVGYTETSSNMITIAEPLAAGIKVRIDIRGVLPAEDNRIEDIQEELTRKLEESDLDGINTQVTDIKTKISNVWQDAKKDFSAVGDGVADDTTALQNALNVASTSGSVKVYVPEGTYNISAYLRLYRNTTIEFHPKAIIKRTGSINKVFINGQSGNTTYASAYSGEGNIHIYGGTIDVNYTTLVRTTSGSITAGSYSLTVTDMTGISSGSYVTVVGAGASGGNLMTSIESISGNVLTLKASATTTVANANVTVVKTVSAFDLGHAENVSFNRLTITNGGVGHYFQISGCKNIRFKDCWFGNVTQSYTGSNMFELLQIEALSSSSFPTFGNYDLTPSRDIYVENCTFDGVIRALGTHSDGLYDTDNLIFAENVQVRNCTFLNSIDNMVNLTAFKDSIFENNLIDTTGGYGIYMNVSEDNVFRGNRIFNTNKAGMHFDFSHRNRVKDTLMRGTALAGTYAAFRLVSSTNNIFDDNSVLSDNPTYTYAFYTSGGCPGTKLRNYNFNKGKSGTISGEFTLSNNLVWCSVGDSITRGNNSGNGYFQDYALPMMPKVVTHYNRGYGGYTVSIPGTAGAYDSIKTIMDQVEVADIYTVELGTNDFSRNIPVGTSADATGKTDSFWGGLKQLYIDLTNKNMNALIIIITPPKRIVNPNGSGGSTIAWSTANTAGFTLTDYVNALKDFASQYGLPVSDWFNESGISNRTAATMTYDGLHPVLDTNKRLGKTVANKINLYI